MRRDRLLSAVRAAAGLTVGIIFWWGVTEPYNRFLCSAAEPLIRALERPNVTRLDARDRQIIIDRTDFRRGTARPGLDTGALTVNVVLLFALFATSAPAYSTRNVTGFVAALAALVPIHLFAIVVNVQSIYALRLGDWSNRHYGPVARNFWGAAAHFYTLVGMFGSAFVLWWLLRPSWRDRESDGRSGRSRSRRF